MRQSALDMSSELAPAELAALKELLASSALKGAHLEIGTAAGGTLKELLLCYALPRPRFVVVDSFRYFPSQRAIVENNLRSAGVDPASVDLRETTSDDGLRDAASRGERFDFILIDANHGARHVIRDLRWAKLLAPGGLLCLHDYSPRFPGVRWAVDRFLRNNRNYRRVGLHGTLMVLQKTGEGRNEEVRGIDVAIGDLLTPIHNLRRSIRKRLGRPV